MNDILRLPFLLKVKFISIVCLRTPKSKYGKRVIEYDFGIRSYTYKTTTKH